LFHSPGFSGAQELLDFVMHLLAGWWNTPDNAGLAQEFFAAFEVKTTNFRRTCQGHIPSLVEGHG
jgi:hypothetical protein